MRIQSFTASAMEGLSRATDRLQRDAEVMVAATTSGDSVSISPDAMRMATTVDAAITDIAETQPVIEAHVAVLKAANESFESLMDALLPGTARPG